MSFLPVGHTHEDIDQLFSKFSAYFRCHNAYTVREMMQNIKKSCKSVLEVFHIKEVAQIKQMMAMEEWVQPMQGYFDVIFRSFFSFIISFGEKQ